MAGTYIVPGTTPISDHQTSRTLTETSMSGTRWWWNERLRSHLPRCEPRLWRQRSNRYNEQKKNNILSNFTRKTLLLPLHYLPYTQDYTDHWPLTWTNSDYIFQLFIISGPNATRHGERNEKWLWRGQKKTEAGICCPLFEDYCYAIVFDIFWSLDEYHCQFLVGHFLFVNQF